MQACVGTNPENVPDFCVDARAGRVSAVVLGRLPRSRLPANDPRLQESLAKGLLGPELFARDGQTPNSLTRGRENRVGHGRRYRRHSRLSESSWRKLGRNDVGFDDGRLVHPYHFIVPVVLLHGSAVPEIDAPVQRGRQSPRESTLGLSLETQRIDDTTAVERAYHSVHANVARRFPD